MGPSLTMEVIIVAILAVYKASGIRLSLTIPAPALGLQTCVTRHK